MKKLYFVRHGECELNVLKVFAGQSESPLTMLGRQQALAAADDIRAQQLRIDRIVSSPLWRAQETATLIAAAIGYPISGIQTNDLFMERCFGMLEGSSRSEFFDAYSYADIDNAPRAETLAQLYARAMQAYGFVNSLTEENILIVSHSAFYKAFQRVTTNSVFTHEYTSPFVSIKNGKVYTILN